MNVGGDAASGASNVVIKPDVIGTSAAKQYNRELNMEDDDSHVHGM